MATTTQNCGSNAAVRPTQAHLYQARTIKQADHHWDGDGSDEQALYEAVVGEPLHKKMIRKALQQADTLLVAGSGVPVRTLSVEAVVASVAAVQSPGGAPGLNQRRRNFLFPPFPALRAPCCTPGHSGGVSWPPSPVALFLAP